jgi:hypothetical protein
MTPLSRRSMFKWLGVAAPVAAVGVASLVQGEAAPRISVGEDGGSATGAARIPQEGEIRTVYVMPEYQSGNHTHTTTWLPSHTHTFASCNAIAVREIYHGGQWLRFV